MPYSHKLTFVMYGGYYGKQQPMFGNKVIGCLECAFSMHGQVRQYTWTSIASSINIGDTQLTVMDAVDWRIGEQIAVASTSHDHTEAEMKTITVISGSIITVDSPFVHMHFSGI